MEIHGDSNVKNVTITLDEETAAWARVYAAQHNMSVSRMLGDLLRQHRGQMQAYDEAMRRFLSKTPVKLGRTAGGYPPRGDLHDRTRLR